MYPHRSIGTRRKVKASDQQLTVPFSVWYSKDPKVTRTRHSFKRLRIDELRNQSSQSLHVPHPAPLPRRQSTTVTVTLTLGCLCFDAGHLARDPVTRNTLHHTPVPTPKQRVNMPAVPRRCWEDAVALPLYLPGDAHVRRTCRD